MLPEFIANSELWGPVFAAGIFVLFVVAAGVVDLVFRLITRRWLHRDPKGLRAQTLKTLRGPAVLFLITLGLFLGVLIATRLPSLPYLAPLSVWTGNIWKVVVIAEITYLAYHLLNLILVWYLENLVARTETKIDDRLLPLIRRILPILVYSFGVLAALTSLSIPISPVWAGLGIGGLAIALAVQPVLSNFFAG